ncbi:MAG: hypothetical protein GY832_12665 [Chloroflexi bacterium]|nr:hypothetical protein [Chloroflexota bacterium]
MTIDKVTTDEITIDETSSEIAPQVQVGIPCEVYSRIVGYLRPVRNWHQGKQQEFAERKTFQVSEAEASRQTCD